MGWRWHTCLRCQRRFNGPDNEWLCKTCQWLKRAENA